MVAESGHAGLVAGNTLSVLFTLLSAREWLAHVSEGGPVGVRYLRPLAWFVPALLSKPTAATLPAAMLLLGWFVEGRVDRRRLVETIPYWAAGGAMGALTIWWERVQQGTVGAEFTVSLPERAVVAGRASELGARLASAVLVDPRGQPREQWRFGAAATLRTVSGERAGAERRHQAGLLDDPFSAW